jgi:BirA family biotin operon repressor/biotin-[acetyl-CoA-carboxylase] ligase
LARKRLTATARKLRREMTDVERLLWSRLRGRQLDGYKFVDQFQIGNAIADFACRRAKPVIELDGGQHTDQVEEDAERTRLIEGHGYRVIRFWNNHVTENLDGVLETIARELRLASD